jgi:hypothetical protein
MALIDDVFAYYKLDTDNATQPDEVGNAPGTVTGAVFAASGKINGGYVFDGFAAPNNIDLGDLTTPFTTPFTVEASLNVWVKLNVATPLNVLQTGFFRLQGDVNNTLYPFTDGIAYVSIFRAIRVDGITLSGAVDRTAWHMVTITTTPGTNGWKMYQNASLIHQVDGEAGVSTNRIPGLIGSSHVSFPLDGQMDEVGIWRRALTPAEITALYNSGTGLSYPFGFVPATPEEGDNDTAHRYLKELVTWTSRQKEVTEYAVPLTTANMGLELLDVITFSDVKYTNGATRTGYITKIKYDLKGRRIWLELMLEPTDIATDPTIYETGTAPTIYNETGAASTITEGQN